MKGVQQEVIQQVETRLPKAVTDTNVPAVGAIKNGSIERAVKWGTELANELSEKLADKKLTFVEGAGLADNGVQLVSIIAESKNLPEDWEYLKENEEYLEAIITGVEKELVIDSEKSKAIVLQAIVVGVEAGKLIQLCAEK